MQFLIGLIILSVLGIGFVFWQMKKEGEESNGEELIEPFSLEESASGNILNEIGVTAEEELNPIPEETERKQSFFSKFFKKKNNFDVDDSKPNSSFLNMLNKFNPKADNDSDPLMDPPKSPFKSLKEKLGLSNEDSDNFKKMTDLNGEPAIPPETEGTAALTTTPSEISDTQTTDDTASLDLSNVQTGIPQNETFGPTPASEIEGAKTTPEAKDDQNEKLANLERLYDEKCREFNELQTKLNAEGNASKEFDNVKGILDQEIQELKEKVKEKSILLDQSENELESYKKQVNQLEGKIASLEKKIETYTLGTQENLNNTQTEKTGSVQDKNEPNHIEKFLASAEESVQKKDPQKPISMDDVAPDIDLTKMDDSPKEEESPEEEPEPLKLNPETIDEIKNSSTFEILEAPENQKPKTPETQTDTGSEIENLLNGNMDDPRPDDENKTT